MFLYDQKGIQVKGVELWLDAKRKVSYSFVSHGHADHLKNHTRVLGTPATLRFHALRARQQHVVELPFGQLLTIDDLTVELFPAGHILGSAMIRIERDGLSLLYTGDFKLTESLTAEPIQIPRADILIMESTYGHPQYVVDKDRSQLTAELCQFIEECLRGHISPVVLAYSLGKAQEAMKLLGDLGYDVQVHHSAWEMAEVYRGLGIDFPNCRLWDGEPLQPNQVLILPPHIARMQSLRPIAPYRSVLLSGWTNGLPTQRWLADKVIPFSDHADFSGLLEFAQQVKPKKIYTTHGFADFPYYLRNLGFDAEGLDS